MRPLSLRHTFDILVIGQRLAILLLAVAAYYVVAGLVIQSFQLQMIHRGSAGSLMNTLLLGMLRWDSLRVLSHSDQQFT